MVSSLQNKRIFISNPFQIGIFLGFMRLKENETDNLRKIAVGIENQIAAEEIRGMLVI